MAQELTVREKRINRMHAEDAQVLEDEATQSVVIVGKKVESIVTREQWEKWFGAKEAPIEARFYELTDKRANDIPIATEFIRRSVLGNTWKGASVVIGEAEERNQVQPNITSLPTAVERLKNLTKSRISPMVVHPNGGHEAGYYLFNNDEYEGMIFADDESVLNMEEINKNLSEEEMIRLSKHKMEHKQGLIGGADDRDSVDEERTLQSVKDRYQAGEIGGSNDGAAEISNLSSEETKSLQLLKDKYEAGEISGDSRPSPERITDLVSTGGILSEVKELVDFEEEIEALQSRFQGRRVTLTAVIYKKPAKLETPIQNQNNAQAEGLVNNNVSTTESAIPAPSGNNPFGGTIPDFAKYVSFAPGALDPDRKN